MSEIITAEQINKDALKFLMRVAELVTVEEYAEELIEEEKLDFHDAINRAYACYDGRETVETLIHRARSICDKHGLE